MMNKMMKKATIALAAATMMITAASSIAMANSMDEMMKKQSVGTGYVQNEHTHFHTMYLSDGTPVQLAVLHGYEMYDKDGNEVVGFADGACKMKDGTILYDFDPTTMSIDEYLNGGCPEDDAEVMNMVLTNDNGDTAIIFAEKDGTWYDIYGNQFWENEAGYWFNLTDHSEWYVK